jgi:hypothetical protein
MFLLHPERISSNYPELKKYLRAYQESPVRNSVKNNYQSDDDSVEYSENDSDVYYDSSDNSGSESE